MVVFKIVLHWESAYTINSHKVLGNYNRPKGLGMNSVFLSASVLFSVVSKEECICSRKKTTHFCGCCKRFKLKMSELFKRALASS